MAQKARNSSPRRLRTRQLLLSTVREHAGITRGELSRLTGPSRSATADGVQDLLAQGHVEERRTDPTAGRGRPSTLLFSATPHGFVGAIDFGHTHVFAAVADTSGRILARPMKRAALIVRPPSVPACRRQRPRDLKHSDVDIRRDYPPSALDALGSSPCNDPCPARKIQHSIARANADAIDEVNRPWQRNRRNQMALVQLRSATHKLPLLWIPAHTPRRV